MKNKSHVYLTALLMFFYFSGSAQNFALGVEGGISSRNLTNGGSVSQVFTSGHHLILGPSAGIFAEIKYTNTFSLQPMFEFSAQGSKKGAFIADLNAQNSSANQPNINNNRAELNYLLIPVLAKFGWKFPKAPLRFYIAGGPFAGLLLSANQTIYDSSPNSDNGQDVKSKLNHFNAGIEGKMGLNYLLGRGNLFIEGGGNYGLIKLQKSAVNNGNYAGSITVNIGYSYWFGFDYKSEKNSITM